MEKEDTYLKVMFEETSNMRDIGSLLYSLSDSFFAVGNDKVSDKLSKCADKLFDSAQKMNDAVGKNINDSLKQSESMTKTVLESVFAGMELERRAFEDGKNLSSNEN